MCELRDFDHGMVFVMVPDWLVWEFQKLLISWDLYTSESNVKLRRLIKKIEIQMRKRSGDILSATNHIW